MIKEHHNKSDSKGLGKFLVIAHFQLLEFSLCHPRV